MNLGQKDPQTPEEQYLQYLHKAEWGPSSLKSW